MKYCCQYPFCEYKTNFRKEIDRHHIKPKEIGGTDHDWNRMWLCPTHHRMIYVPESSVGVHASKGEKSIIVIGWIESTAGLCMRYIDCVDGREYIWSYKLKSRLPM